MVAPAFNRERDGYRRGLNICHRGLSAHILRQYSPVVSLPLKVLQTLILPAKTISSRSVFWSCVFPGLIQIQKFTGRLVSCLIPPDKSFSNNIFSLIKTLIMKRHFQPKILFTAVLFFFFACQKENLNEESAPEVLISQSIKASGAIPPFNLEVILRGADKAFGHIKFRQDNDAEKIILLDIWIRDLLPNHEYRLQRAVDPANVVDGICTSTSWLTLGKGLEPQSLMTDASGTAREQLWRSVAAVPSATKFDIHFRVIDAVSGAVVLTSECYEYVVR